MRRSERRQLGATTAALQPARARGYDDELGIG